ncbi:glycosyltransferase family 2 protein [Mesorhizobium sp.]|uniref:glycosyltransferase family 2 protein n=1 Tax=Mesorhizobium sp. TaxID=1871066 RepID=UPI00257C45CD|nr:glycosyltransferase family 2 protein [Mesorhizobium sp.]
MISVIVPVLNEAENIRALVKEILGEAGSIPIREIVYVDDGSTDDTLARLIDQMREVPILRVVHHDRALGQSAAFLSGARAATQELLVFMDGDLQNDPADIAVLLERYRLAVRASNTRIAVLGQRAVRNDSTLRKISSRLANGLRASVLNDGTRDTGCSLKLIRREDFLALPYFDHVHRSSLPCCSASASSSFMCRCRIAPARTAARNTASGIAQWSAASISWAWRGWCGAGCPATISREKS